VIIVPTSDTTKKDSVTLDRTKPATNTPLCLTC
jgi:hypothetical protein